MENNNKKGRWVTINGAHVLIKNGQSVNEAMQETFKGKRGKKRVNQGKFEYSADEGNTWEDMDEQSYNELDADEDAFDENIEDDFGFDNEDNEFSNKESRFKEGSTVTVEDGSKGTIEKVFNKDDKNNEYIVRFEDGTTGNYDDSDFADDGSYRGMKNDEPNPMNEFSGPDREGTSYAQLEGGKKDLSLEDAIKSADNDVLDSQFGKDTPERKLAGAIKNETQSAKETWPPQDLKQYIKKTEDGYAFDSSIFDDKSLEEIEMALDHPDAKNNLVIRNGIMAAAYRKLKNMSEYGKTSQNMKIPDNVRSIPGEKPTINPADVTNEPNRKLYSYLKEKYPDAEQNSLVSNFLETNNLQDSGLKGNDSIADVYAAIMKNEQAPDTKEMEKINFDKRMKRVENIKDELESIGFRFNHSKYSDEQLSQFEDKISEFNKLKSERKLKEAAKIRNEIEAML